MITQTPILHDGRFSKSVPNPFPSWSWEGRQIGQVWNVQQSSDQHVHQVPNDMSYTMGSLIGTSALAEDLTGLTNSKYTGSILLCAKLIHLCDNVN